ncbi:MAG: helix-turn-helix domain-containing protein, partial [Acetobacteraceae bacterium]
SALPEPDQEQSGMTSAPDTLGASEAAAVLRISPDCLLRKARTGKVPGAKIGRQWVFRRDRLLELIDKQAEERRCRSIAAPTLRTGGVDFSSTSENRASQLARRIESELKSLKPQLALVRGGKQS